MVCPLDSVLFISRVYQDSFIKVKLLLTGSFEMRWEFSLLLENKALRNREGAWNTKEALKVQSKRQPTMPLPQERRQRNRHWQGRCRCFALQSIPGRNDWQQWNPNFLRVFSLKGPLTRPWPSATVQTAKQQAPQLGRTKHLYPEVRLMEQKILNWRV